MANKKIKFYSPLFDIANLLEIIGAFYIFFYLAQIIRGSPLVIGIIFVVIGYIIKLIDMKFRKQ